MSAFRVTLSACVISFAFFSSCQTERKRLPPPAAKQTVQPGLPKDLAQIQEWEDRRSLGDGQLTQWALTANDPLTRGRSLLALARIQEPSTAETVGRALSDPSSLPRYEAAFAAGVMGLSWAPVEGPVKAALTEQLAAAEAVEIDAAIKAVMLEALGRLGTPAAIERLTDRLSGTTPEVQARAALSLGVAAKRDALLPARAITALVPLIKKEAPAGARYGAAFALALSKSPSARPWLLVCTQDDESEVRALCAKGLGDVGLDPDAVTLKRLLDDSDYRVAVEATRALAKLSARCRTAAACPAIGALSDLSYRVERLARGDSAGGGQPLLALAQAGLPPHGRPLLMTLRGQVVSSVRSVTDKAVRADLAKIDCRLAAALDRQVGTLSDVLNCGGGLVPEPRRLAMGLRELALSRAADPAKRVEEIGSYVHHNDPMVKLAALTALGDNGSAAAAERVRTQIGNPDLIIAAAAAGAAAKLKDREAIPAIRELATKIASNVEVAPMVGEALVALDAKDAEPELRAWLASTHVNVRIAAAAALSALTGQPVAVPRVERPEQNIKRPYLPKDAALHFKTEKGEFDVKLYTAEAPLTSLNLYTLGKKGYFKNLLFHRVVPDFVAQGGDPRGDGEGGPGYTLRCEVNHKPYARGVLGMALSGKDTGGSQFFVTTSPQPHLDGRYTAFGEITKGQSVVDALLEGDKILEVRATP
ncbi:MAG: peptidylprolyl isomerase [Myxococcaceae bacterium]